MPTINDYKKRALNNAGYSGDINTAENKWLKAVCTPYSGSTQSMWSYALKQAGYTGPLPQAQQKMLTALGYTTGSLPNRWYKYWRDTPLYGLNPSWVTSGAVLDLDFANSRGFNSSARSLTTPDSILTYTAPSPKLVYGSDGLLQYAPHNLVTYSQQLDSWTQNSATTVANAAVAPDGSMTADHVIPNAASAGSINSSFLSVVTGMTYTASVYVNINSTLDDLLISIGWDGGDGANRSTCNVQIQAKTYFVAGIGTGPAPTVTIGSTDANGWYRVTVTGVSPSTNTLAALVLRRDNGSAADGTKYYRLWGVQFCNGSNALTYVPTTSAAKYNLPVDYNPTTLAALGVLIEEQRTNLLLRSQEFDNAEWVKDRVTVTANSVAAPDGTTTADTLDKTTAGVNTSVSKNGVTVASGASYTLSCYLKAGTLGFAGLTCISGGTDVRVYVNLATGVTTTALGSPTSVSAVSVGNGWWRLSITITTDATSAACYVYPGKNDGLETTMGTVYAWGAQLEAGAFPTSYIPTVASQVTRAMDDIGIATSAFAYSTSAGTYYVNAAGKRKSGFVAGALTDGNLTVALGAAGNLRVYTAAGSLLADSGVVADDVFFKAATGYTSGANASALSRDGASVQTYTNPASAGSTLQLLQSPASGGTQLNGWIKRLTYFPTRKSNSELQALAT